MQNSSFSNAGTCFSTFYALSLLIIALQLHLRQELKQPSQSTNFSASIHFSAMTLAPETSSCFDFLCSGQHERGPDEEDGGERHQQVEERRPLHPQVREGRGARVPALHLDLGQAAAGSAQAAKGLDEQNGRLAVVRDVLRVRRVGQEGGRHGRRLRFEDR